MTSQSNSGGQNTADKTDESGDCAAGVAGFQAKCEDRRQNSAAQRVAIDDHRGMQDIARRQHNADEITVLEIQIFCNDRLNTLFSGLPSQ